jgi:hypothetical protein
LLDGALTNRDREFLNYPTHMWNVGADFIFLSAHSLNANVRGWHGMHIVSPFTSPNPGGYDILGGELYVDLNYVAKNAVAHVDVSLFATNIFGNTDPIGMVVNNGVFHPRGRGLGFQISKRF